MPNRRSDSYNYPLLVGGSATGASVAIPGGEYMFMVDAATNGGTIALQVQSPSGTWVPVAVFSGSLVQTTGTLFSQCTIDLGACNVRCFVNGSATGVNAYLVGVG